MSNVQMDLNEESVIQNLRNFLANILSNRNIQIGDLQEDEDFSNINLTSIDYLEFVIRIEKEYEIDIPDEFLIESRVNSIKSWSKFIELSLSMVD